MAIQRLNYHTGLFLGEVEFRLEQDYHILMRRRLNYALFTPGVLYGLSLDYEDGNLTINPGMAIEEYTDKESGERLGREIIVSTRYEDATDLLKGLEEGIKNVWITISYNREETDLNTITGYHSRITESFNIEVHTSDPGEATDRILLGQINLTIGGSQHVEPSQKATLKLGGVVAPTPTIEGFKPESGGVGTNVIITGTNFTGVTGVTFGGVAVPELDFKVEPPTKITAKVPTGAETGRIRISTNEGFGESAMDFTVQPAPEINSLTPFVPQFGEPGKIIKIFGSNFNVDFPELPTVTLHDRGEDIKPIKAGVESVNDTEIEFKVPDIPGQTSIVDMTIQVTTSGGSANSPEDPSFRWTPPLP